jgi:hypothetical protein
VSRETTTAFSALTELDPLHSVRHHEAGPCLRAADASVEMEIARIMGVAGDGGANPPEGRGRRRPTAGMTTRTRPRFGVLGLAASAALAVIATLLWVAPSAGQPVRQVGAGQTGAAHHEAAPTTTPTTPVR